MPEAGAGTLDDSKIEDSNESNGKQETGDGREAEQNALPELNAEHVAPGQAIVGNGPAFDTPHNPTGEEKDEEVHHFSDKKQGGVVRTMQQPANHQVAGFDQGDDDCQEDA